MSGERFNIFPRQIRPLVFSGLALAGLAMVACGPAKAENNSGKSNAAGDLPMQTSFSEPATATIFPTNTPEPTATPEPQSKFADYGVYYGTRADGGRISMIFLPDGRIIYTYFIQTLKCLDGRTIPGGRGILVSRGKYGIESFGDDFGHNKFSGRLTGDGVVEGTQKFIELDDTGSKPKVGGCETSDIAFRAIKLGTGKDAAVSGFSMAYSGPSDARNLADLEASSRITLP